jgi:putative inorganic carbon (hco3(-)) transporter
MRFGLCCLFIALYIIRPFEFLPFMYDEPILLFCGVLGLLAVLIAFVNKQAQWHETDTLMVGFFLAVLLSHASHLYFGGTISAFQKFLPIFLGYFLIAHSITVQRQLIIFLYVFTFCTCIVAVEGCFQYYQGVSYFGIEPLLQNYYADGVQLSQVRIKWLGPFSDPNDLALLFVIPIPFLLARFKQNKIVSLAAGALLILGIFYTNSRGGVLSLIVAIVCYFILRYRNKTGLALGALLGVCLLLIGPSRMGQVSAEEGSAYGRLEAWYAGFQMFKESPFFGVGMGMFTDFHELTAHNSFVLVMAELGLFGLFFFTGLFWVPLKKMKFSLWGEGRNSLPTEDIALFSAMTASLAAAMTAMFFLSRSYILIPYMLIALMVRLLCFYDSDLIGGFSNGKTLKEVVLLTATGIVFINIFIKVLL